MSKMRELAMDIEHLLRQDKSFADIARELEIPINFVVEAAELVQEDAEPTSPYATINS